MKRREFLVGLGTSASVVVAGCATGDSPAGESTDGAGSERGPTATPSATPTPSNHERRLAAFRSYITERDVTVEEMTTSDDGSTVSLRYRSRKSSYQELGGEIGMIAGGFFRQVDDGWDVERLDATVLQDPETPFGTWHAEVAWYERFREDELTGDELSLKVLQTLERPD